MRHHMTNAAGRRVEFLVQQAREMRIVHFEEILRDHRRRRVDQNVDAAEFGGDLLGHRADRGIVIDVGGNADDAAGVSLL